AVTAPFGVLGDSADRVIGGMHWHMAQLGHYNIARNFLGIAKNVPSAGVTVLFPRMAALYAEGRHEELHRTFYEGIRKLLLLMTPLVVLGIAFSKLGVRMLYGAEFLPASTAINGFLIMVWLNTLLTPYHFLVYAIEKHQKFAYIMPISQLLYIAAFFIVTGAWSPFGLGTAAFVNCIPNVVPMIVVAGLCLKHTGISFDWSIWRFLAAGLLMYLPFAIITPYWQGAGGLFLATPLSVGLYILGVFRLRKMIKSDISYFLDLIHPHRLYQYVRGEISQA
ncbi:MAG TPA: lipopolysaccharide biosynthesis protein, partial [Elusimicrobiota bacterium]|nr:lipopolysaccharide biosynthesis protein [Elusimicrobiota bacterium]